MARDTKTKPFSFDYEPPPLRPRKLFTLKCLVIGGIVASSSLLAYIVHMIASA